MAMDYLREYERDANHILAPVASSKNWGRWGGGEGGGAGWGGGAVDAGYVDAFLAAALTRVMRAAVPIPAVGAASVLHSATVSGSVVGDVGPL